MKKKMSKVIAFLGIFILLGCTFSSTAEASWYGWTYATFKVNLAGQGRYYDGNNVGLNWGGGTHNSIPTHINTTFTVTLMRKGTFGWSRIGTVTRNRAGADGATWTNVGSGTYRFDFSKANDGTTQYVTDIEMFSW